VSVRNKHKTLKQVLLRFSMIMIMIWNLITKCSVKSCHTACMNWLLVLLLSMECCCFYLNTIIRVGVKIKLSVCLIKCHAMKAWRCSIMLFSLCFLSFFFFLFYIYLTVGWGRSLNFMLHLNTLGKVPPTTSPSNQYVWGWVDPRTSLDSVAKRKVLASARHVFISVVRL